MITWANVSDRFCNWLAWHWKKSCKWLLLMAEELPTYLQLKANLMFHLISLLQKTDKQQYLTTFKAR